MGSAGLGAIGLDIGATKTPEARVNADGAVQERFRLRTEPGSIGVLRTVERVAGALLSRRRNDRSDADVGRVGGGIPGLLARERGAVTHAVNLGVGPVWVEVRQELERRLGLPV